MSERKGAITFKGNPMTLVGEPRKVGDKAPDATLVANDLSEKKLSDFGGQVVILSVVPSLDTGICDKQTRRFNEEAGKLGQAVVLTVSRDLPFAQKRWCGAAGVEKVQTLSDHRDRTFGTTYGLHIKELGLLARSVMVIDRDGTIRYQELVPEIAQEPNYDAALAAAKKLL